MPATTELKRLTGRQLAAETLSWYELFTVYFCFEHDIVKSRIKVMADVFSKHDRSEIMKKVKSSGNKSTEGRLIQYFHEHHITGWRRHYPVKGHPDFVFIENRVAIFVDGCFWHGHNCRNTKPVENAEYWRRKQERNILHDQVITNLFIDRGWTVIRIWECELTKKNRSILDQKLLILNQTNTFID